MSESEERGRDALGSRGPSVSDGLNLKALHGVKWATVANWSGQAAGLVTMLVLARILSPTEFGIYAIGSAFVMVVMGLSQIGLPLALVQREHIDEAHLDTAFWTVTGLAAALAASTVLFNETFARAMGEPNLAGLLPAMATALPLTAMAGIYNAPLMRGLDFRKSALATTVGVLAGSSAAVALALAGAGVWSLVGQTLLSSLVTLGVLVRVSPFSPGWRFSFARLRELWRFGSLSMLTDFVALVDQRSVPLFLGAFVGAFATGLYSMARRVVDLGLQAFVAAIGQVATPTFSRLQTDRSRMRAIYLNTIQSVAALSLPMFGLAAVLAEQVVLVFLGPKWIAGAGVLALVSVAALIRSYGWISVSVLIALGRARLRLALQLISLSLSLLVLFTLWPGGILAVAKGFVVQAAAMHVLIVLAVRGCLKVTLGDYLRAVGPVFLAAGGGIGAALAAKWMLAGLGGPLVTLVAASAAGLLVHGAIIRMLVPALVERLLGYAREIFGPLTGQAR